MRASSLFDPEKLERSDEELADALEVLCDLVANVIRPAMGQAAGHMDLLDRMLSFDDKAQEILQELIPTGANVEAVIQEYTERSDTATLLSGEVEAVAGIYASAAAQIARQDDALWDLAEDLFHGGRAHLLGQNEARQEAAESVNRTLDALTDRVDRMGEQLSTSLAALRQDMNQERASRQRMVGAACSIPRVR
jgi:hypothetical protein